MKAQLKTLATLFLMVVSATTIIVHKYREYADSDAHTCVEAYRTSGHAHIKFKSVSHHYNWCDLHINDWYELSVPIVQIKADEIRARKGYVSK
jgi:hypothetical protein